jgi:hypothetical protein
MAGLHVRHPRVIHLKTLHVQLAQVPVVHARLHKAVVFATAKRHTFGITQIVHRAIPTANIALKTTTALTTLD